jgi:hypothetical protein
MSTQPPPAAAEGGASRPRPWRLLLAAAALIVVVVVVVILLTGNGGNDVETGVPKEVSAGELRDFAEEEGHDIYWAGPVPGFKVELTKTKNGNVFVRYLPSAVPIGDQRPNYTTIATYPRKEAFNAVVAAARGRGQVRRNTPGGAVAVYNRRKPTSVYLAYPDSSYLVEIYAASPQESQQLATSGRVAPVR